MNSSVAYISPMYHPIILFLQRYQHNIHKINHAYLAPLSPFQQDLACGLAELSTSRNLNRSPSGTRSRSNSLNRPNNIHTFNNRAENNVLAIQPCSFDGTQEELRSIGIGACVRHGEDSRSGVLKHEVLISEFVSLWMITIAATVAVRLLPPKDGNIDETFSFSNTYIDRLSTGTVVVGEISTLTHEISDDTMEA